jgi:hypothetical protein
VHARARGLHGIPTYRTADLHDVGRRFAPGKALAQPDSDPGLDELVIHGVGISLFVIQMA